MLISTITGSDLQGNGNFLNGASATDLEDEESDKARPPFFRRSSSRGTKHPQVISFDFLF